MNKGETAAVSLKTVHDYPELCKANPKLKQQRADFYRDENHIKGGLKDAFKTTTGGSPLKPQRAYYSLSINASSKQKTISLLTKTESQITPQSACEKSNKREKITLLEGRSFL